jgi:hypothetical protein
VVDGIWSALETMLGVEDRIEDLGDKLKVDCETETEALVSGEGARYWYRVHLKRLVKSSSGAWGIWTAVMVEYAPPRKRP